jgi:hypothetical protein
MAQAAEIHSLDKNLWPHLPHSEEFIFPDRLLIRRTPFFYTVIFIMTAQTGF